MFHMELFSSSIASGANTFAQLTYSTPDNILPKLVNGMQVSPNLPYLMMVAGVGAHMVHVRPQSNSMLPFPYPTLSPNNIGTAFESPARIWDFSAHPIPLKPTEEFDIFATQNKGSSETEYVFCNFSDNKPLAVGVAIDPVGVASNPATPGRFFSSHWTSSTTLSAGAWTAVQPTFDQALYAGYYALVGARAFSATALAFRMFPAMGPLWRPGGIAVQTYDQLDPPNQRGFNSSNGFFSTWGAWLYFYQNVPPQVEFFATSADSAEEGWFDLVYLGPQAISSVP
jgi:hypothetical protein